MGLIENDEVVWKKKTALAFLLFGRAAQEHEEQGVIEDNHVGREQSLPGLLVKTARILSAGLLSADVRFAANLRPHFRVGLDRQITERTVAGRARPFRNAREFVLLGSGK